ncbi:adenosinetriphosphatase [Plasmodium inui San Antonio 1]|uniref:ATP-dependent RNA helicase n=1 Tax=Plasmodium inui San Antonio 1 TaxID=1237626 RepID=W7A0M8_9APIC|nr:adenosinetriphosphatase [Plasmodium inui San Antonio 1]EUD65145.1 adenosinetriphosphatase [Plasmodium inui San Antonio 1]
MLHKSDIPRAALNQISIKRSISTTIKLVNYNYYFLLRKNEKGAYRFFHHKNNLSSHFFEGKKEHGGSKSSISYNNKMFQKLYEENPSEGCAGEENFPNVGKTDNRKWEEGTRHENLTNEDSPQSGQNKILNRHEYIDLNLLNIDEEIVNNLKEILKIDKLYMYQYIIFNEIFANHCRHVLVYNKTGTGKTLSYLLPLIQKLINEKFDCNRKILILTQNIYLCKQLYIYILSIYPNLNVCILFDEHDPCHRVKKIKRDVIGKEEFAHKLNEKNNDLYRENYGIHFYLAIPNKLEFYIKNYNNTKKNEKNVMNNILNCVNTIVVDEFDYVVESRNLIFNFLFKRDLLNGVDEQGTLKRNDTNGENFNRENYEIYLFTANMNELIRKKINNHLCGFVFFDFINGVKEVIQNKLDEERASVLKNSQEIIQLLSRENKTPSLCNLNIAHFICKINTPSKYKYVSYFLNEFFFLKRKDMLRRRRTHQLSDRNDECDGDKLIRDYMGRNPPEEREKEDKIRKCIIFANSKEEVEKLHENSLLKPHSVIMHSELLTLQKNENINMFKLGKKPILITTDIVSRGLDIDNVIFILNYSPPTSPNDYIHRSGRTGRAKEKGVCLTMYHKYEYKNLDKIMKYTKNNFQVILCPHVDEVYKFSVDNLTESIMKIAPEEYEFLHDRSKELLKTDGTKIIAQVLSVLLKHDRKGYTVSLLSGKRNYVAVLIKDPFFEAIKNKNDIVNLMKVTTGNRNVSNVVGDVAKCDEGYIADISSTHVNKIISLFNSSNSEYKNKGVQIDTVIELPPVIREKKTIIRRNRKVPWIKYKLQKKKIIVLGRKTSEYKRKGSTEIIKDINRQI